ncbi:hypothetical protein E2562_000443 [Oryza meyeriana var. granulata]|uniref:Uncharacterized protein n=1 Tax=Oryza meyeriana var. granulata TaxID=110450 RepID=A0A6G1CC65_9ORYZ|nr:hypothetical protein E2562_000443 [Oryza meyeriana var. granulata]
MGEEVVIHIDSDSMVAFAEEGYTKNGQVKQRLHHTEHALTEGDGAALLKCSHHGSGVMATGFVIALFAVSVGISFRGYGLLLSLLGILTGVALIAVGVRTTDDPTAFGTTMLPDISLITVRLRRNLAVAGLVVASAAIAGITGEASPVLCFSLFATLLVGIALITAGVLGGWTA